MAYDFSSMLARLTTTFGESVTHRPVAPFDASYFDILYFDARGLYQTLTMIPYDPSQDGEEIPGVFLTLSAPSSSFLVIPTKGDTVTFRSTDFRVFDVLADLSGLTRLSLTVIA